MKEARGKNRNWPERLLWASAAALTASVLWLVWGIPGPGDPLEQDAKPLASGSGPAEGGQASEPSNAREPASDALRSAGIQLRPGESPHIDSASLDPEKGLDVRLSLPDSNGAIGVKSIRLYSEGRDPIEIPSQGSSVVTGELELKLESAWLSRGRHIIELRTDERHAIPLRRFSIEVD